MNIQTGNGAIEFKQKSCLLKMDLNADFYSLNTADDESKELH